MAIIDFDVFKQRLFLNTANGDISDDLNEIKFNDFEVSLNTPLDYFHPTAYSFCLNISDVCNLRCSYCFNANKKNALMKEDEAIKALDAFFSLFPNGEKYYVDLSGKGEPLLNKKVIKAISLYCQKKSDELKREVLPMLVCNGTLLDKTNVAFLQKSGVLFGVSLDGNKTIHDLHRKDQFGEGSFDKIIHNVLEIKNREYVGCAATLTNTIFPLKETIEYLSSIFNTLSFRLVRSGVYGLNEISLDGWKKEYSRLALKLKEDIDNSNLQIYKCLLNGDDLFGRYLYRMFSNSRTLNRCDSLITRFTYDESKIYGCPASSGINSFAIEAEDIPNIQKQEYLRQVNECPSCPYKLYCGGECKLESARLGQINKYNCNLKIHLIQLAAYLKIYCLRNNMDMFIALNSFCKEKAARNRIDPKLKQYCDAHPELTFSQAKIAFDNINKRY